MGIKSISQRLRRDFNNNSIEIFETGSSDDVLNNLVVHIDGDEFRIQIRRPIDILADAFQYSDSVEQEDIENELYGLIYDEVETCIDSMH